MDFDDFDLVDDDDDDDEATSMMMPVQQQQPPPQQQKEQHSTSSLTPFRNEQSNFKTPLKTPGNSSNHTVNRNQPTTTSPQRSSSKRRRVESPKSSSSSSSRRKQPSSSSTSTSGNRRSTSSNNTPKVKVTPRRFPGPAGILPPLVSASQLSESKAEGKHVTDEWLAQQGKRKKASTTAQPQRTENSESEGFESGAWLKMLTVMKGFTGYKGGSGSNIRPRHCIATVLCGNVKGKVPMLCVMIKNFTLSEMDASLSLVDPSGEMKGTLHRGVFDRYAIEDLTAGAVLVLKQVSVFSPAPKRHYLNVTPSNILHLYPSTTPVPEQLGTPTRSQESPTSSQQYSSSQDSMMAFSQSQADTPNHDDSNECNNNNNNNHSNVVSTSESHNNSVDHNRNTTNANNSTTSSIEKDSPSFFVCNSDVSTLLDGLDDKDLFSDDDDDV